MSERTAADPEVSAGEACQPVLTLSLNGAVMTLRPSVLLGSRYKLGYSPEVSSPPVLPLNLTHAGLSMHLRGSDIVITSESQCILPFRPSHSMRSPSYSLMKVK